LPQGIVIKFFSVFYNGNDISNGASYMYCTDHATFYLQFDGGAFAVDTNVVSLSDLNFYCGNNFEIHTYDANFVVTMSYYIATTTSSSTQSTNNIELGLAILITLASISLVALIANNIKKPWR